MGRLFRPAFHDDPRALAQRDPRLLASARPPHVRLLVSALFAAQPTDEPSDHERGQQERLDHAHGDEHIGENDSGAALDGHDVRSVERIASRVHPLRFFNVGVKIGRPKGKGGQDSEV